MAARGLWFERATSPVPLTLPAHASLLSGLEPLAHGARSNGVYVVDPAVETLAERLAQAGYHTAAAIGALPLAGRFGLNQGFARYDEGGFTQRAAVKLVRSGMASREVVARFAVERQLLARLEHPAIARLLDGGIAPDGRPWFAMERPAHRHQTLRMLARARPEKPRPLRGGRGPARGGPATPAGTAPALPPPWP